ncbi:MAG: hypothetical protein AAGJ08_04060 [Cyanobacteria bacterium P01_H01_bin.35]
MTTNNNQNPTPKKMEKLVIRERLRQARLSFNIALSLTIISAIVIVTGVGLLLSGKTSQGTATTAGGLASQIISVSLLKKTQDTNERLDKIATQQLSSEELPLKGKVIHYDAPYEPVALEDWEALK